MQIGFKVTGLDKVEAFLKKLPFLVRQQAAGYVADYLIGDDSHGLRHYPGYKVVSRVRAYGQTFFSDRQRRWFFANLREGKITPWQNNRTGAYANAWKGKPTGGGGYAVSNDSPYAQYLGGTIGQDNRARQPAMVGWRWVKDVIETNIKGAFRHAQAEVTKWLKSQKVKQ